IALGALLFGLALFAAVALRWREQSASTPKPSTPAIADAAAPASLAVLPFRSLTPGPQDELMELGLADTLITRISVLTTLRVRSLTSSQRLAGARQDPIDAGRQLGATYVVEGTFQRDGGNVRVGTRLLDTRDGTAVWSGTFDQRLDRVFTLQDRIASDMSSALALKLVAVPGRSPCDGANAEAYRAYLTGRYQLDRPSGARMRQALAAFQQAIALDPSCARAYAGTAYAYRALVITGDADPRETFPLAKAAVGRALAIDPKLAEAYSSQGFIRFWYDWDWQGAEASFQRAIALNPSLAEAYSAYAHLLSDTGRKDEAARLARQAIALDPLSPIISTLGSGFLAAAGHREESQRSLQKALELDPDFWVALLMRGGRKSAKRDYTGAIADLERARSLCGACSQVLAVLGPTYVLAGNRSAAEQVLREMQSQDRDGYFPATSLAKVENALGNSDAALDLLERAYRERDVKMAFLKTDSGWKNLRSHPRFQALMQRMAFPATGHPVPLEEPGQRQRDGPGWPVEAGEDAGNG
ncbi:MAG: tetratricopeptide repeat protein, partial [Pseudomonadota bacterium]|nr:tetratricopeptide repeat protein [Pseudomonadota bacterium]